MILQNRAPSRISVPVLLGAGLLLLLALPGWSAAGAGPSQSSDSAHPQFGRSPSKKDSKLIVLTTGENVNVVANDDEDSDNEKAAGDNEKEAAEIGAQVAKELQKELGPGSDFEKEMKNLGEELKKELGPGSEFEKSMKGLGGELEKQLGPGSDFQKSMLKLGEDLQKQLGPGSDFERSMQGLGERMATKFGEGSEFAQKMKKATNDAKVAKPSSDTPSDQKPKKKTKAQKKASTSTSKTRALKALRAQIDELNAQLKKLEEADGDEND